MAPIQRILARILSLTLFPGTLFLALLLFSPVTASGAVWYVSTDGDVSGDGTT